MQKSFVLGVAAAVLSACSPAKERAQDGPQQNSAQGDVRTALDRALEKTGRGKVTEVLPSFRVWPRGLSGSNPPVDWGSRLTGLELIDAPIGTGLGVRMQFNKNGNLTLFVRGVTGYRLFLLCSVEPSITNQPPDTLGLVRWQAILGPGGAERGSFTRDPVSNYWAFATAGVAATQEINVQISSPNDDTSGNFESWAIGFCDVLPFKYDMER